MKTVSCIIPAYNEEGRIGKVLQVVKNHPMLSEIIVVDDGSKDKTSEEVKLFPGIKLIQHPVNKGKSTALCTGITSSKGELLLFLDADLIGLSEQDITDLIEPVTTGKAKISISLRNNTPRVWIWYGLDYLSGERVLAKEILVPYIPELLKITGYGIEVFMNRIVMQNNFPVAVVYWKNVSFAYKMSKEGFFRGLLGEVKMFFDILRTISPFEAISQIRGLKRLAVK